MSGYLCFQIELTRGYDYSAFREDLKKLYNSAGVEGKNTVFLFTDTQVGNIWIFAVFPNLYSYLICNRSTLHSLLYSVDQIFVNCSIWFLSYFLLVLPFFCRLLSKNSLKTSTTFWTPARYVFHSLFFIFYFFKQSLKYSLIVHKGKKKQKKCLLSVFKSDKDKAKLCVQLFRPK